MSPLKDLTFDETLYSALERTKILTLAATEMNCGDVLGDVGQMEDKWCKSPHVGRIQNNKFTDRNWTDGHQRLGKE